MTLCNFNFYPGSLIFFYKHVGALEMGFYTSRRHTMQLNRTQPSSLHYFCFCCQVQTIVVTANAHPLSYSRVAITSYPIHVCKGIYFYNSLDVDKPAFLLYCCPRNAIKKKILLIRCIIELAHLVLKQTQ